MAAVACLWQQWPVYGSSGLSMVAVACLWQQLVHGGGLFIVKTTTEVGVRAIQDHKVIEWNTCWKCRLSEGTDDM